MPTMEQRFEEERPRLLGLARRMLGSSADAEDALQEVWIRITRADENDIENPGGWLTTVTARVCLNQLRSRGTRREDSVELVPEPGETHEPSTDPLHRAVLADAVGLALHVVLDRLSPDERVAFVLHDLFAVPFDEIAPILDRSVEATRQLASRARRRVRNEGSATARAAADPEPGDHRAIVDAFFAAARSGDLSALVGVLHPDVVLVADRGLGSEIVVSGSRAVGERATMFARPDAHLVPIRVADRAGVAVLVDGRFVSVMVFGIDGGRVVEIETTTDAERLAETVASLTAGPADPNL